MPANLVPFSATDIIALIWLVLAAEYFALWWRDREPGMGWFGVAMIALAAWVFMDPVHVSTDRYIRASNWNYVLLTGLAAIGLGLIDYVDVPQSRRRWMLALTMIPVVLSGILYAAGIGFDLKIPRAWLALLTALCFIGYATVSFDAHRRERDAGHALVGLVMLAVPAIALSIALYAPTSVALRYYGIVPILILSLTLLTVSLLRRRRRLEQEVRRRAEAEAELSRVNASLEAEVQRRTSELQDMVVALESFNRSVSHDLRGPLGGIAGVAQIARRTLDRGDIGQARHLLSQIEQQADESGRLVQALLELARVGDSPMKRVTVDVTALAEDVVASLSMGAATPPPPVDVRPLPTVTSDPELLRAVLRNLIGNAQKFSSGRPDARVRVEADVDRGIATVRVRDNGIGFDARNAGEVFRPFVRLNGDRFVGHGVGLSIVRRAVDRLGGTVHAEGQPGEGATFSFTLPIGT